jgi:hypothetical protein
MRDGNGRDWKGRDWKRRDWRGVGWRGRNFTLSIAFVVPIKNEYISQYHLLLHYRTKRSWNIFADFFQSGVFRGFSEKRSSEAAMSKGARARGTPRFLC